MHRTLAPPPPPHCIFLTLLSACRGWECTRYHLPRLRSYFFKKLYLMWKDIPNSVCVDMSYKTFTNLHCKSPIDNMWSSFPGLFNWCLSMYLLLKCHVHPWCTSIEIKLQVISVLMHSSTYFENGICVFPVKNKYSFKYIFHIHIDSKIYSW
jgi:hypothetical protein